MLDSGQADTPINPNLPKNIEGNLLKLPKGRQSKTGGGEAAKTASTD